MKQKSRSQEADASLVQQNNCQENSQKNLNDHYVDDICVELKISFFFRFMPQEFDGNFQLFTLSDEFCCN